MTHPLQLTLDVACTRELAFHVWTRRISTWWPADHTVSGAPEAIVLEGRPGGRIYETGPDGTHHDWGVVTLWDPPRALGYTWHLGTTPDKATQVLITFQPTTALDGTGDTGATRISIDHSGWDRWGSAADTGRERNLTGWESLLPHYRHALSEALGPPRHSVSHGDPTS